MLEAGINDWGGVSPVTVDHVNPEAPWPELELLGQATRSRGLELAPRLTIYPEYAADPERWLDPAVAPRVLALADSEGLAREDNWAAGAPEVGTGGPPPPRAVALAQGAPSLLPAASLASKGAQLENGTATKASLRAAPANAAPVARPIAEALAKVGEQVELDEADVTELFRARGRDLAAVVAAADSLRREVCGDAVTYVVTRNINYTNVCYFRCGFCAFSKGKLAANLRGAPYLVPVDEIVRRCHEAWERGGTEVCLQGGIHPAFTGDFYVEVCRAIKEVLPDLHVHAFSALEVWQGAATLELPLRDYLGRLQAAGLASLPGTAAEVLDDEIRAAICPDKVSTEQWLEVHSTAHAVGLSSTTTIMFGHVDGPRNWARHLLRLRDQQRRSGGFTEFVPLPFVHTTLYGEPSSERRAASFGAPPLAEPLNPSVNDANLKRPSRLVRPGLVTAS